MQHIPVRIKRLRPADSHPLPRYMSDSAAGMDLCANLTEDIVFTKLVRENIEQAAKKNEADWLPHFYSGQALTALGRYGEAIGFYRDYLTYFGTNLNVLNSIGDCYVQTGDLAGAITVWKKSLELNPSQPELKQKLAAIQDKIKEA